MADKEKEKERRDETRGDGISLSGGV